MCALLCGLRTVGVFLTRIHRLEGHSLLFLAKKTNSTSFVHTPPSPLPPPPLRLYQITVADEADARSQPGIAGRGGDVSMAVIP
jgi:hypothetical protein